VVALLERRPALLAARRALPRGSGVRLTTARSLEHLLRVCSGRLLDAVLLGPEPAHGEALAILRREFPSLPALLFLPLRSDDAELLLHARRLRVASVMVEGVDEPVLARMVARCGATARRLEALHPLAPRLRLEEPLQSRAWEAIIALAPYGLATAALARRLGVRRETLSRQFAAGGAPPLHRAIAGLRVVVASELLTDPGYPVATVARLLRFSSPSLLHATARRIFGAPARRVAELTEDRLVAGFLGRSEQGWN
jgi:AraC-like DNA-binding protein